MMPARLHLRITPTASDFAWRLSVEMNPTRWTVIHKRPTSRQASAKGWRPAYCEMFLFDALRLMTWALLAVIFLASVGIDSAWAQGGDAAGGGFARGAGGFLSVLKMSTFLLIFLLWIYSADWINRDCKFAGMSYVVWNMVVVFPFMLAMILALAIPAFIVGFFLLLVAYSIPLLIYVIQRNGKVDKNNRVLTPRHIGRVLRGKGKAKSRREQEDDSDPEDKGPPVGLIPMGSDNELTNKSNLLAARQSPGFVTAREVLYDALKRQAERIMLDYTQDVVSVRMEIDGVWHDAGSRDRENGDFMLAVLKKISDLNEEDRRSRQVGKFGSALKGRTQTWNLLSQGTKTGERAVLQLNVKTKQPLTLEELGLRPKLLERLQTLLKSPEGMLFFSSLPGGGLSTTLSAVLRASDRFTRHFVSFEDEARLEPEVDNVDINTIQALDGKSPADALIRLLRTEPDVVVVPSLSNGKVADVLCQHAADGRLIISTIRANEAVEALLRVLMLKVSVDDFAPVVKAVVNQRLIRKLCDSCKEAYEPPLDLLKKLRLPPGRIEAFYREPQNRSEDEEVCAECGGIGHRGRTSVFEILVVNDQIREAILKRPKLDILRKISRQAGNRSLQEEGIVLVARGVTSLQELTRVLKQ